jgi:hypothetical protein
MKVGVIGKPVNPKQARRKIRAILGWLSDKPWKRFKLILPSCWNKRCKQS